jgi:hypothetical protein
MTFQMTFRFWRTFSFLSFISSHAFFWIYPWNWRVLSENKNKISIFLLWMKIRCKERMEKEILFFLEKGICATRIKKMMPIVCFLSPFSEIEKLMKLYIPRKCCRWLFRQSSKSCEKENFNHLGRVFLHFFWNVIKFMQWKKTSQADNPFFQVNRFSYSSFLRVRENQPFSEWRVQMLLFIVSLSPLSCLSSHLCCFS